MSYSSQNPSLYYNINTFTFCHSREDGNPLIVTGINRQKLRSLPPLTIYHYSTQKLFGKIYFKIMPMLIFHYHIWYPDSVCPGNLMVEYGESIAPFVLVRVQPGALALMSAIAGRACSSSGMSAELITPRQVVQIHSCPPVCGAAPTKSERPHSF